MRQAFTLTAAVLLFFISACCHTPQTPVTTVPTRPEDMPRPPKGDESLRDDAFQRGLEAAQKALELERVGDLAEARRHLALAENALKTAQAAGLPSAPISNNLGVVQSHAGLHDEALKQLQAAAEHKDVFQDIYTKNLADAYARADRWQEAAARYRQLAEANPGDPTIASGLVDALATEGVSELRRELTTATLSPVQQSALAIAVLNDSRAQVLQEEALVTFAHAAADRLDVESRQSVAAEAMRIPDAFSAARNELVEILEHPESTRQPYWWNGNDRREEAYVAIINGVARRAELDNREGEAARLYRIVRDLAPTRAVSAVPLIESKIAIPEAVAEVDGLVAQVNRDAEERAAPRIAYRYHRAAAVFYANANRWEPSFRERGVRYHVDKAVIIATANPHIADPAEMRSLLDSDPSRISGEAAGPGTPEPKPAFITPSGETPEPTAPVTGGTSKGTGGAGSKKSDVAVIQQLAAPILFDFDETTLSDYAKVSLDRLADAMKADPAISVCIEGHTDWTGGLRYNYELGRRRAQAVKDYLLQPGVAAHRVATKSFGERKPAFDNTTNEGRRQNRRAAVSVDTTTCDQQ